LIDDDPPAVVEEGAGKGKGKGKREHARDHLSYYPSALSLYEPLLRCDKADNAIMLVSHHPPPPFDNFAQTHTHTHTP